MVNDGRIPRGLLLDGKPAIRNALKEFDLASQLDKENEKRPPSKQYSRSYWKNNNNNN